jgi:hypothetical protein
LERRAGREVERNIERLTGAGEILHQLLLGLPEANG